ncbi:MAG TPA: hypothetical protein VGK74_00105 [Symbiobacteriaceae bacterium]
MTVPAVAIAAAPSPGPMALDGMAGSATIESILSVPLPISILSAQLRALALPTPVYVSLMADGAGLVAAGADGPLPFGDVLAIISVGVSAGILAYYWDDIADKWDGIKAAFTTPTKDPTLVMLTYTLPSGTNCLFNNDLSANETTDPSLRTYPHNLSNFDTTGGVLIALYNFKGNRLTHVHFRGSRRAADDVANYRYRNEAIFQLYPELKQDLTYLQPNPWASDSELSKGNSF